jgi:hypothetical protein
MAYSEYLNLVKEENEKNRILAQRRLLESQANKDGSFNSEADGIKAPDEKKFKQPKEYAKGAKMPKMKDHPDIDFHAGKDIKQDMYGAKTDIQPVLAPHDDIRGTPRKHHEFANMKGDLYQKTLGNIEYRHDADHKEQTDGDLGDTDALIYDKDGKLIDNKVHDERVKNSEKEGKEIAKMNKAEKKPLKKK